MVLFRPLVATNDFNEITVFKTRDEVLQHVSLDVAEGGFWAFFDSVSKGSKNLVLEIWAWVCGDNLCALFFGNGVVAQPQHVMFNSAGHQGNFCCHVQWNLWGGVQSNCVPDFLRSVFGDAVRKQETTSFIGAVDFETLIGAAVLFKIGRAHV